MTAAAYGSRISARCARLSGTTKPISIRSQTADTRPRSRGTICPRFAYRCPSKRGSRECRMRAAPAVSCAKCARKTHTSIQGSGEHPTFPAQWLYGLSRAHPGEFGLCCLRRLTEAGTSARSGFRTSARLDANHRGVRSTRFCRTLQHRSSARPVTAHGDPPCNPIARTMPPRPPHPIPTFGDDGQRPFPGDRMAGVVKVICPTAKAKFCPTG